MRLLDARTLINEGCAKLVEYVDDRTVPPYAILSHTWGSPEEEVLFEDIKSGRGLPSSISVTSSELLQGVCTSCDAKARTARSPVKGGWHKVYKAAERAWLDGYHLIWIDTCCIDKSSSAELSEAINSMFRWYKNAAVCYVYLVDFDFYSAEEESIDEGGVKKEDLDELDIERLRECRWFTRGWTLQELIAPNTLYFFDYQWHFVTSKSDSIPTLKSITGIHYRALESGILTAFSVAQRMHWASKRTTTRLEDEAYCLLGLFDINMPLLYGEGRKAFRRLQEAIVSSSVDSTIFAWELLPEDQETYGHALFAPSAANFWWNARDMICFAAYVSDQPTLEGYRLTSQGLLVPFPIQNWRLNRRCEVVFADLKCMINRPSINQLRGVGLRVRNYQSTDAASALVTHVEPEIVSMVGYRAPSYRRLVLLDCDANSRIDSLCIRTLQPFTSPKPIPAFCKHGNVRVYINLPAKVPTAGWRVKVAYPNYQWHAQDHSFTFPMVHGTCHGVLAIETENEQTFIVIVGVVHQRRNDDSRDSWKGMSNGKGYFQYWIFPCDGGASPEPRALACIAEQFSSLAAKDLFESEANRQNANKAIVMPNGDLLRVSSVPSTSETSIIPVSAEPIPAHTGIWNPSLGVWQKYDMSKSWMHVRVDLQLIVEEGGACQMAQPRGFKYGGSLSFDDLIRYTSAWKTTPAGNLISAWTHTSAWKRPLHLATDVSSNDIVITQAWYFEERRGIPAFLRERPTDFHSATFDRNLWTCEQSGSNNGDTIGKDGLTGSHHNATPALG